MLNKNENLNFSAWVSFEEAMRHIDMQTGFKRFRSDSSDSQYCYQRKASFWSDSFNTKDVGWKPSGHRKFNWFAEQYEDQVHIEFKHDSEDIEFLNQEIELPWWTTNKCLLHWDFSPRIEVKPLWLQKHLSEGRDSWAKSQTWQNKLIDLNHNFNRHLLHDGFELNGPIQCDNRSDSDSEDRRTHLLQDHNDKLLASKEADFEENKIWNSENDTIQHCDQESSHQHSNIHANSVSTSNDNSGSPLGSETQKQTPACREISSESFSRTAENKSEIKGRMKKRNIKLSRKSDEEKRISLRKCNPRPEGSSVRKRTKLRSSGESSSVHAIDLSKRRDVVNKTILRVLRRYLAQEFKTLVPQQYEDKEEIFEKFYENVRIYANKIFGESNPDIKILHFYLASVIDHRNIKEKDMSASEMVSRDLTVFYDWLYKYSHTRLVNLFGVKPLGVIFEYFYNSAKDNVLKNEVAWAKNKALYSKVLEEFLFIFQGKIDIATLIE